MLNCDTFDRTYAVNHLALLYRLAAHITNAARKAAQSDGNESLSGNASATTNTANL